MKKQTLFSLVILLLCCTVFILLTYHKSNGLEMFLQKHNLTEDYQKAVNELKVYSRKPKEASLREFVNGPANDEYKAASLKYIIKENPARLSVDIPFNSLFGVRYDPQYSIDYLMGRLSETLGENLQLLILWNIYRPEMIQTDDYRRLATQIHEQIMAYLSNKRNWQASWRDKEYAEKIGTDYQKCYADTACLLDIIPYWMDQGDVYKVIIPCEVAGRYRKRFYFDGAGGGSGSESFLVSDCSLYSEFKLDEGLDLYLQMLSIENMLDSEGTIRFYFSAVSAAQELENQYQPDFDLKKIEDWTAFPYTEWAVKSYTSFKKFNQVLNFGIGYKKALEKLTDYYVKGFKVSKEKALNKALTVLNPPSSLYWRRITPENLRWLLLTGADWEQIEIRLGAEDKLEDLLELSVACPHNLEQIIKLGKGRKGFSVDQRNSFGKTPLMLAAQYGYLDSVKLLLENGADINQQTDDSNCWSENSWLCIHNGKRSALMYAAQEKQYDVVKYLLEKGADKSLRDSQGKTAAEYLTGEAPESSATVLPTIVGGGIVRKFETQGKNLSPEQEKELRLLLFVN